MIKTTEKRKPCQKPKRLVGFALEVYYIMYVCSAFLFFGLVDATGISSVMSVTQIDQSHLFIRNKFFKQPE